MTEELIKKSDAIKAVNKAKAEGMTNCPTYYLGIVSSIDIVRCQDCKYWVYNFNGCSRNPCTEPWLATDFCNYGEKK